jgi:hypothetical protein
MLQERRLMIEKGMTPPSLSNEMLCGESAAGTRSSVESSLRNGILLLAVGVGLFAAFLVFRFLIGAGGTPIPDRVTALLGPAGVLVALIGLGHLAYFRLARDRPSARDL